MSDLDRVLFVDDDPAIRDLIDVALGTVGGMTALGCASGHSALQEASSFDPQLVVLDVMMPEMDGPMTLNGLRDIEGLREVPAVFLTAKVHGEEVKRLKALGASDVLAKPFDPITLADALRNIWRKAGEAAEG